jgi:hypothetical protein
MQHAKGGIAKRIDALGVNILLQQAAENIVNCLVREALVAPESVSGGGLAGQPRAGKRSRHFARIYQLRRLQDSFRNRSTQARFFYVAPKMRGCLRCRRATTATLSPSASISSSSAAFCVGLHFRRDQLCS